MFRSRIQKQVVFRRIPYPPDLLSSTGDVKYIKTTGRNIRQMKMRKVGRTDLRLPVLVLGAMARRQSSDKERIELFESAIDQGFNAIDTAPLYGFGRAEQQL